MDTDPTIVGVSSHGFNAFPYSSTNATPSHRHESAGHFGFDLAEEYLNLVEPMVDSLRSNSNPLLSIPEQFQQHLLSTPHTSQPLEVPMIDTSAFDPSQIDGHAVHYQSMPNYTGTYQADHELLPNEEYFHATDPSSSAAANAGIAFQTNLAPQLAEQDKSVSPRLREKRKRASSSESANSRQVSSATHLGGRYRLEIAPIPHKSRVETQIKLHIKLLDGDSQPVTSFRNILLDDDVIAFSGRRKKDDKPEEELFPGGPFLRLKCHTVTSYDPNTEIYRCAGCTMREKRTLARKTKSDAESNAMDLDDTQKNMIVFHCQKYVDFHAGEATLPARVTCYCRHHKETVGFGIVVSLLNGVSGQLLASSLVGYIMITDDHKSQRRPSKKAKLGDDDIAQSHVRRSFLSVNVNNYEDDDTSSVSGGPPSPLLAVPQIPFGGMSPITPPMTTSSENSFSYGEGNGSAGLSHQLQSASFLPSHESGTFTHSQTSNFSSTQDFLLPQLGLPSSPSSSAGTWSTDGSPPLSPSVPKPTVDKVIPQEGPISGGVEVTLLGNGLLPGHRCFFGGSVAKISAYWGPTTIVCVLPPATVAGTVPVYVMPPSRPPGSPQHSPDFGTPEFNATFTYKDDSDRQLLELALQLIGMKMNGKIEDARQVAMQIVKSSSQPSSPSTGQSGSASDQMEANDKEAALVQALSALLSNRVPSGATSDDTFDVSIENDMGQTLLHLAIRRNYTRLVDLLVRIARGEFAGFSVDVNAMDHNGWTPLHVAASYGQMDIIRVLLNDCGAIPVINDEAGLLPYEVVPTGSEEAQKLLHDAASAYGHGLATASSLRNLNERAVPENRSQTPPFADPSDDIEAAKESNLLDAAGAMSTFQLLTSNSQKLRHTFIMNSLTTFVTSIRSIWESYRLGIYFAALMVLGSLSLFEVLPYNFRSATAGRGMPLTTDHSDFNGSDTKGRDDPLLAHAGSSDTWNLYFFVRLVAVCAILFALLWHFRERLLRRSPAAFGVLLFIILVLFTFGTLYIFNFLPF